MQKLIKLFTVLLLGLFLSSVMWLSMPAQASPAVPTASVTWTEPQRLSTTSSLGASRAILQVADNGTLLIVYNHRISNSPFIENPYYRMKPVGGEWSTPAPIYVDTSDFMGAVTALFDSNNEAHAVWRSEHQIFYAHQDQWATNTPTEVSPFASGTLEPTFAIGADDAMYIVWRQGASPNTPQLYFSSSFDGGDSWSVPQLVISTSDLSAEPNVAVDSAGNVHLVWRERVLSFADPENPTFVFQLHYLKGTRSGNSINWGATPTIIVSESNGINEAFLPYMLVDESDAIHVSFARRESRFEQYAYYVMYDPVAGVWSDPQDTLADPINGSRVWMNTSDPFVLFSTMAFCGEDLHLYYHGALADNSDEQILGVRYDGSTWPSIREGATVEDPNPAVSDRRLRPTVVCHNGTLHMAYEEVVTPGLTGISQIYYQSGGTNTIFLPSVIKK